MIHGLPFRPPILPSPLRERLPVEDPPTVAVDPEHHIVFWNRGAERLFGRRAPEVLGRRCHEILQGRDIFGNRCCYPGCASCVMLRSGEGVQAFEIQVSLDGAETLTLRATSRSMGGSGSEGPVVVHTFEALGAPARAAAPDPPLTRREREILGLVVSGLQNKEVAQKLGLSLATVRNHVHNILEKLGVHSKIEAAALAFRAGWVLSPGVIPSERALPAADTPSACTGSFGR
jgi:DNA-binding CsgD family transcriptional regulator